MDTRSSAPGWPALCPELPSWREGASVSGFSTVKATLPRSTRSKGVNTPALIDQPASGTYKINPDCTGTAFLTVPGMPGAAQFRFVVVNRGKEIFFTLVNPIGPMTLTHAVRQ